MRLGEGIFNSTLALTHSLNPSQIQISIARIKLNDVPLTYMQKLDAVYNASLVNISNYRNSLEYYVE